ncbi:Flavin-containing monooxygenase [Wickerhamomyces ciferrii]|uniref:Flavin-containing monooxygenase n=1 Tax=Wickerhamomyces ciferrii (strain ATCC 14091 / BCRC 22168 / CBS 111 / JCM 3599 / NBRC 0793 / NRRL Y-1031 F-60-10) TaxID=1206466 RepID=K0KL23_WICCF|nr:Flavin-containing monooxygenase [Wickerhamomyces ciferrii]CCH45935.1 Flavin-containing monooxygenase [Wickerhamomyces ciferrii]
MTVDKLNIESIAVIGGGPGGIAATYEFLHTKADGTSTVGGAVPEFKERAFKKIVGFEQKDKLGGTWATSIDKPDVPDDKIWEDEYYKPEVIHPKIETPSDLSEGNTYDKPLVVEGANNNNQWRRSPVYPGLYTNVPRRFLRFSSIKYEPPAKDSSKQIDPLITYQEVGQVLDKFTDDNKLLDYFRLNSQVQDVKKTSDGKWVLTIRETKDGKDHWYIEQFDAVAVASGHYSVPYIPKIEGLSTREPGSFIHAKSFRTVDQFKDQNVIIAGSSLSGVDIAQYLHKVVKSLTFSRTPNKPEIFPWIKEAVESYPNRARINKIDGKTVYFDDGTSQDNVDKIIFATGYHWDYPYLSDQFLKLSNPNGGKDPIGSSRIKGLFWDTININDPTLGFVGVTLSSLQFHTIETSAAVLAGIWSNAKTLPPKEEQRQWEQKRLEETVDSYIFHYYPPPQVKEDYVDKLWTYVPKNRPYLLENEDFGDFDKAIAAAESVFYEVREGKYT